MTFLQASSLRQTDIIEQLVTEAGDENEEDNLWREGMMKQKERQGGRQASG